MEMLGEVIVTTLVPILGLLSIALLVWKWIEGTHRERMAMIEKGMNPNEGVRRPRHPLGMLRWALLITFVGIGLLVGVILNRNFGVVEEVSPVLGLISGGCALLLYYRIASRKLEGER